MEMKEILEKLEGQLKKEKIEAEELEKKIATMMVVLENAEKALGEKKDNITSLEMMIEAGKEGHFGLKEVKSEPIVSVKMDEKPVQEDKKPANSKSVKPVKQPEFKHKNAFVVQINEYDNVMNRWRTQKAAARGLNWDQSSLCKFMKLDKSVQINKKGFALLWEY
jgi:chromosome segregation ATPase